jgi:ribonuclease HII
LILTSDFAMPRARNPKNFRCTRRLEIQALRQGWRLIAGCDEAGRGALLGPVYAAAVILDPARRIPGVDDSKKLTAEDRRAVAEEIRAKAVAFRVVAVPAAEVDCLNVFQASRQGMIRALCALVPAPDFVITDAVRLSGWGDAVEFAVPYRAVIHGDARCVSVAAASILAKVARDAHMQELDLLFPQFQLAKNKGYGTPEHLEGLKQYGPCREHRQTFQPVKSYLLPLFPFSLKEEPS